MRSTLLQYLMNVGGLLSDKGQSSVKRMSTRMCLEYPPPASTISINETLGSFPFWTVIANRKFTVLSLVVCAKVESSDMSEVDIAQATRLHKYRPSKVGVGRLVTFWDGFLLGSIMICWKVLIKDSILNLQIVETQALGPSFRSFWTVPFMLTF